MGDLLIRNLDSGLKRDLQERAKQSGRSLSEEAVMHCAARYGHSANLTNRPENGCVAFLATSAGLNKSLRR